jgi:hypothetical protein
MGMAAVRPASRRKERREVSVEGVREEDDMAISCGLRILVGLFTFNLSQLYRSGKEFEDEVFYMSRPERPLSSFYGSDQAFGIRLKTEEPALSSGPWGI